MFSDPNMAEWFSGLLLMVASMAVLVGISSLFAWTVIRVLGDEEIGPQVEDKTQDGSGMSQRKRTAA